MDAPGARGDARALGRRGHHGVQRQARRDGGGADVQRQRRPARGGGDMEGGGAVERRTAAGRVPVRFRATDGGPGVVRGDARGSRQKVA